MTGFDLLALAFVLVVVLATLRDRDRDHGRIRKAQRRTRSAVFARAGKPTHSGRA